MCIRDSGLIPEEYGGDTMFVDVSATARTGLAELLEAIILTADAELDLRANPDMPAQGVAIRDSLDRGRGPVATVLVHRGTLHVGDSIVAGSAYGRVRAMINDQGDTILEAPPSTPVQVLGLTSVSGAGDNFLVVEDDRKARQIAERRESRMRAAMLAKGTRRKTLDQLFEQLAKGEVQELKLILKGDTAGSVEALEDELLKIEVGDDVSVRIIDRGVGAITETNVTLASASDAVIIGYNVRPQGKATELADREGVDIRYYSVIYQAIDEVEAALKGMLKPVFAEEVRGQAQIREIFRSSKIGTIAVCMVDYYAACDVPDLGGAEDLPDLGLTAYLLGEHRLEHALEGGLDLVDRLVDDRVVADVHAFAVGELCRLPLRPNVVADDDRVGGGRQRDVRLGDRAHATVDDPHADVVADLDLEQLVFQSLHRTSGVALEDELELLDLALGQLLEQLVERLAAGALGQHCCPHPRLTPLGDLTSLAVVLHDQEVVAGAGDRRQTEHLDGRGPVSYTHLRAHE